MLSQLVLSRVRWAFACKDLFQLRLLSFFQRLCLSFYSIMTLVSMYCFVLWCEYEVELAQQFSSCRERLQPDCRSECVAVEVRG